MTHRPGILRRFRFNRPQRIAAGLLALFLVQGSVLIGRQALSDRDYEYARCGREMWEKPSPLAGYFTTCGNIHDGVLAYRLAGLPLTLNLLVERGLDRFRKEEDRVMQTGPGAGGEVNIWELRHQLTHISLLLRLPFLAAGCLLGGCLWWVTRRLFGNRAGYMALGLYCFSPAILRACAAPNAEVLAGLGVFGGIYTCIGVAHAMQGPRRKWRPRILLLTAIFAVAAASHIVALPLAALCGILAMLWVAEGRRSLVLPIVLMSSAGALVLLFACYGFSPDAFSYVFRSGSAFLSVSLDPARRYFSSLDNAGVTCAAVLAVVLYLILRRSRYFGNTTPLLCALVFLVLQTTGTQSSPWLWSLPFLFTFIAGVFADAFDTPGRSRVSIAAASALVGLQVVFCLLSLFGPPAWLPGFI
jgi:hypothetical protein